MSSCNQIVCEVRGPRFTTTQGKVPWGEGSGTSPPPANLARPGWHKETYKAWGAKTPKPQPPGSDMHGPHRPLQLKDWETNTKCKLT